MILHLLSDPDFFLYTINQFEQVNPQQNIYLVFGSDHYCFLNDKRINVPVILYKTLDDLQGITIEGVIVHFLTRHNAKLVNVLPEPIPVLWSCYGIDLYGFFPKFQNSLYEPETLSYIRQKQKWPLIIYRILKLLRYYLLKENRIIRQAMNRIEFYSTVIPNEKEMIPKYIQNKAQYLHFSVGTFNFILRDSINSFSRNSQFEKYSLFVGNSASISCNYLDVLELLKIVKLPDKAKVNLQVSYGEGLEFINYLKISYKNKLGDKVKFINDRVDEETYFSELSKFNVFLFNTKIPQGMWAIYVSLWNGGKVFLNSANLTFDFLKSKGITVFSIERDFIGKDVESIFSPLDYDLVIQNRQALYNYVAPEFQIERARDVVLRLKNFKKRKTNY